MFRRSLCLVGIAVMAVVALPAQSYRYTMFPQLAAGNISGGTYTCDFSVNNQGFLALTGLNISFYDDSGQPLPLQTDTQGSGSSFDFDLAGGQTYVLKVSLNGPGKTGYAVLRCGRWDAVTATLVVRFSDVLGRVITELGVPQQFQALHYSFAAEVKDPTLATGVNTGMAFANRSFSPWPDREQTFLIDLIAKNGSISGSARLRVGIGEHVALFLTDPRLFPVLSSFEGTVSVSGSLPFGLLVLRLEQSALGTVAVNEGPVLAPFYLNLQTTPETETNDSRQQAQSITAPIVISGTISTASDVDYFKFNGKKGDVLSAMVETQPRTNTAADSFLDSELILQDAQGNMVSQNDQNGVYPQDDSCLRLVLPEDGVYYLKLWDFWGDYGGSRSFYRLHVKLLPTVLGVF